MINNWLRKIWKWFSYYPNRPLVYICYRNGVAGIVRADAFDAEVLMFRRNFNLQNNWPLVPVRPIVFPVYIFGPPKPGSKKDFRTGTLEDLESILERCAVEERSFFIPDAYAEDFIPEHYPHVRNGAATYRLTSAHMMFFHLEHLRYRLFGGDPLPERKY